MGVAAGLGREPQTDLIETVQSGACCKHHGLGWSQDWGIAVPDTKQQQRKQLFLGWKFSDGGEVAKIDEACQQP